MKSDSRAAGFTLLEVLVALLISSIAVGSVMHSISTSMRLKQRSDEKAEKWEIMRSAAAMVLADPQSVMSLEALEVEDGREIRLEKRLIRETEAGELNSGASHLVRVRLRMDAEVLEMSMMVPADFEAPGGEVKLPAMKSVAEVYGEEALGDKERAQEARREAAQSWDEASTYNRVISTAPSAGGGTMVAGLGGASRRPSMSGGSASGSGAGGWADPVEDRPVDEIFEVPDSEGEAGEADAPDNDPESAEETGGGGDENEGDNEPDPPISPPPGNWERVDVSGTEYYYVNTETGQMFRIWQGGTEDYMRWQKEWVD